MSYRTCNFFPETRPPFASVIRRRFRWSVWGAAIALLAAANVPGLARLLYARIPSESGRRTTLFCQAALGQLRDVRVAHGIPGSGAAGYVTGFTRPDSRVVMHIQAAGGLYQAVIRYNSPAQKGFVLTLNGEQYSGMFPPSGRGFRDYQAGLVELKTGANTVWVGGGWDYYNIDRVKFIPAYAAPRPGRVSPVLCDPDATPQARALMRHLAAGFGRRMLLGTYSTHDAAYDRSVTGVSPSIIGGDLINYSPSRLARGQPVDHESSRMIRMARKGYIVTLSWHWNDPTGLIDHDYTNAAGKLVHAHWWFGFYTKSTTFNLANVLAHPNGRDYKLMISNIDAIAVQLLKFQRAGIPVLWRPLHEASGGRFWWGAHGPGPFKKLWRLLYRRLTYHFHLHNLIWVYTSGGTGKWFSGNQYVDIVGVDQYPKDTRDPLVRLWNNCRRNFPHKLLAVSEYGGVVDAQREFKFGVYWDYAVSWSGYTRPNHTARHRLQRIYHQSVVWTHAQVKHWGY